MPGFQLHSPTAQSFKTKWIGVYPSYFLQPFEHGKKSRVPALLVHHYSTGGSGGLWGYAHLIGKSDSSLRSKSRAGGCSLHCLDWQVDGTENGHGPFKTEHYRNGRGICPYPGEQDAQNPSRSSGRDLYQIRPFREQQSGSVSTQRGLRGHGARFDELHHLHERPSCCRNQNVWSQASKRHDFRGFKKHLQSDTGDLL